MRRRGRARIRNLIRAVVTFQKRTTTAPAEAKTRTLNPSSPKIESWPFDTGMKKKQKEKEMMIVRTTRVKIHRESEKGRDRDGEMEADCC